MWPHFFKLKFFAVWAKKKVPLYKRQKRKVTLGSRLVSHASTNSAQRCLTSLIGREAVFPTWYEPCIRDRQDLCYTNRRFLGMHQKSLFPSLPQIPRECATLSTTTHTGDINDCTMITPGTETREDRSPGVTEFGQAEPDPNPIPSARARNSRLGARAQEIGCLHGPETDSTPIRVRNSRGWVLVPKRLAACMGLRQTPRPSACATAGLGARAQEIGCLYGPETDSTPIRVRNSRAGCSCPRDWLFVWGWVSYFHNNLLLISDYGKRRTYFIFLTY
jgi:hypothetical protein